MPTKRRCPKCSHLNSLDALRCARCGADLVQACPLCGRPRPWYVERCPHCQSQTGDDQLFTSLFRRPPDRRLAGRYVLQETLATSRVSAVYRALGTADGHHPPQEYAIKELSPVALFRPQERREVESALRHAIQRWSRIDHPNLARLIDSLAWRGRHYVVFELVRGRSMKQILEAGRLRITPDLAANWGAQLCQLVEHLQAQEPPLHVPFLAPGHVMVTPEGQVKLVDLGLTHLLSPTAYGPYGSIRGYAAPELHSEAPSVRSDSFAVGRLLYALLVGRLLEKGLPAQLPLRRAVPGISTRLVKAIARAAHRDPGRRYASMTDLRRALCPNEEYPVKPIEGWARDERYAPSRVVVRPVEMNPALRAQTMADMGFAPDPRFGPRPLPRVPGQTGEPGIYVYPRHFNLTQLSATETRRLVLTLRNTGHGELVGRVVSHVDWIRAPKKALRLPERKQARVILTLLAARAPSGKKVEPQALSVDTNAGRHWIAVTTEIATGPSLKVEQSVLDFGTFQGEARQTLSLGLSNAGRQPLSGRVISQVSWLRVPQGDFRCPPGSSIEVRVHLVPEQLPTGQQSVESALIVDSDGGQARTQVSVHRLVPMLALTHSSLDFGSLVSGEVAERVLRVENAGEGSLEGVARALVPWLRVHPARIACGSGESMQLSVTVDSLGLPDGVVDVTQALRLQTNAGTRTLPLHVQVRAPRMVLETPSLDYGPVPPGETRERPLVIRNEGSAPLEATIQPLADWLVPSDDQITCPPGDEAIVQVRADTACFPQGQDVSLPAALRIVSGNTIEDLPANITIVQPALEVEPGEVDFGYVDPAQPESRTLLVRNRGTGELAWNAQTDAAWLEISPTSGVCDAGEDCAVALTAYGLAIDSNDETTHATLVVNSDGGRAKVPMRVGLASPLAVVDTALLDLGTSTNYEDLSSSLRIFNRGLGFLRGSIESDKTWLVVHRASFECATGRSIELSVSTDMEEFPRGVAQDVGLIAVASNGGNAQIQVSVRVELAPHIRVPRPFVRLVRKDPKGLLQGRLQIQNKGLAMAHTRLSTGEPQLTLSRNLCDIKPGKSVRIMVRWQGLQCLDPDRLYIDVLSGDQRVRVPVVIGDEGSNAPTSYAGSQTIDSKAEEVPG